MTLRADWATGDLVSKNNKQLKIGGGNIARWIERFPSANAQSLELDTQHWKTGDVTDVYNIST